LGFSRRRHSGAQRVCTERSSGPASIDVYGSSVDDILTEVSGETFGDGD
jgi:hypothetical protein